MCKIIFLQIDLQLVTRLVSGDVSVNEVIQIVQGPAAVILGYLVAVLVDQKGRKSIYVLFVAQVAILLKRAVDFGDLDIGISDEFLSQLLPCRSKSLAVSAYNVWILGNSLNLPKLV